MRTTRLGDFTRWGLARARRRRLVGRLGLVAAVFTVGLTTACGSTVPGSATTVADLETRGPAGAVPAGLAKYYGQPLGWGDCTSYATTPDDRTLYNNPDLQCARLTVPLDYSKPNGATITLGLLRLKATDQQHRIGSLIVNPGGPGASGMELAASLAKQQWAGTDLAKRFDLVGFDPRGIGSSEPEVRCYTGAQQDSTRAANLDDDTSPAGVNKYEAQQRQYASSCVQHTTDGKQLLANVGTRDVAKDLDVLRSALGDAKLNYLGFSYGTFIGTNYAEQFPANVRAMVLDGAVDPNENPIAAQVGQAAGFQTAFNQFAQWCAARPDCALGTDPSQATQNYRNLVIPLLAHPVPVGDGRVLTYDDATTGTIAALYTQSYWQYLNTGLAELKQQTGRTLMTLADLYDGRSADGTYSNEQDAFNAVECVDSPPITDPATLVQESQRYKQAAPFLDNGRPAVAQQTACDFWPVPPTSQPHQPNVTGMAPPLVISTTNDPATPYQNGVNLSNDLHGALLTFVGTQHTSFLQGNACVDKVGADYLINLTLPAAGTRCT